MKTEYFAQNQLETAGYMLANGKLVAFPTETVFGLGADARDDSAIRALFAAKGRPSDNPLIVHIASVEQLGPLVKEVSESSRRIFETFWPGPITLVFPKSQVVSPLVTAGLDTVAIRIPSHPWALEILQYAKIPVAAPSANRSGSPSATTWQAVQQDLDQRIDAIVCGPPTDIGLESTVVDASGPHPRILRPGKVTFEQIAAICPTAIPYLGSTASRESTANSPGLRHRHYQPRARVVLVNEYPLINDQDWYIGLQGQSNTNQRSQDWICESVEEYSSKLFDFFRQADNAGAKRIYCERVSDSGLGVALMDRLKRASEV